MIDSHDRRSVRWAEHFGEQFSWPDATSDLAILPANELMQVNASPPSEIEVIRGITFLRMHKSGGQMG